MSKFNCKVVQVTPIFISKDIGSHEYLLHFKNPKVEYVETIQITKYMFVNYITKYVVTHRKVTKMDVWNIHSKKEQ